MNKNSTKFRIIFTLLGIFLLSIMHVQADIAVVLTASQGPYEDLLNGFKSNISAAYTVYDMSKAADADNISKIKDSGSNLLLAVGTKAVKLAQENFSTKKIVYSMIVDSSEFTGANITGVTLQISPEAKLNSIKNFFPSFKTIGIIYSDESEKNYTDTVQVAEKLGFKINGQKISSDKEVSGALKNFPGKADCLLLLTDKIILTPMSVKLLLMDCLTNKLPVIGISSFFTKAGALCSFECDYKEIGVQAAGLCTQIVGGKLPKDIPPATPAKTTYSINITIAKKLGVDIAGNVLSGANTTFGEQ